MGMFLRGFGVTARGLTWFSNTLKDGFGYLVGTQNHVRPMIWGIVLYFGVVYPWASFGIVFFFAPKAANRAPNDPTKVQHSPKMTQQRPKIALK